MKQSDTAKIVTLFAAAYPGWTPTPETVTVWCSALGDLDAEPAVAVADEIIRTGARWPTIATFRRLYAERAGLLAPPWSDAWAEATAVPYDEWQPTDPPKWSHPAVKAAVDIIGRWEIAHAYEPGTLRAQFRNVYEQQAQKFDDVAICTMQPTPEPPKALPSADPPTEALPERGEFPAELVSGMREEFPPLDDFVVKISPRPEPSPVKWSQEVTEDSPFVAGLREQGWTNEQIADELAKLGRVVPSADA